MDIIGNVVFNELASRRVVTLPEVGSLRVEYIPASVGRNGEIVSPENIVAFSRDPESGSDTVIDVIRSRGIAPDGENIYREWLAVARNGSVTDIGKAGIINDDTFTPSVELIEVLNPDPSQRKQPAAVPAAKPVKDRRQDKKFSRRESLYLVLSALLLVLLAIGWIWWHKCYREDRNDEAAHRQTTTGIMDKTSGAAGAEQTPTLSVPEKQDSTPASAGGGNQSGTAPQPQPAGTRYYVVGGIFAVPANADKFIQGMKNDYPDLAYETIPYPGGKTLVSFYSSDDSADANSQRRNLAARTNYPELWVYESK